MVLSVITTKLLNQHLYLSHLIVRSKKKKKKEETCFHGKNKDYFKTEKNEKKI